MHVETELKKDNAKNITFDRAHRLGPKWWESLPDSGDISRL
jgi:hypothetical protein